MPKMPQKHKSATTTATIQTPKCCRALWIVLFLSQCNVQSFSFYTACSSRVCCIAERQRDKSELLVYTHTLLVKCAFPFFRDSFRRATVKFAHFESAHTNQTNFCSPPPWWPKSRRARSRLNLSSYVKIGWRPLQIFLHSIWEYIGQFRITRNQSWSVKIELNRCIWSNYHQWPK